MTFFNTNDNDFNNWFKRRLVQDFVKYNAEMIMLGTGTAEFQAPQIPGLIMIIMIIMIIIMILIIIIKWAGYRSQFQAHIRSISLESQFSIILSHANTAHDQQFIHALLVGDVLRLINEPFTMALVLPGLVLLLPDGDRPAQHPEFADDGGIFHLWPVCVL